MVDKMAIEGQQKALEFLEQKIPQPKIKQKVALVECAQCHKVYPLDMRHRHLADDVVEYGSQCQHCQAWHSVGYFNQELLEWQKTLKNRRQKRAFKRKFAKFQIEVAESLRETKD